MSRALSSPAKVAIFDEQTAEVFVQLIEISHASLATPIRVNSSGADIIHGGNTYVYYPFELIMPDDVDGRNQRAKLRIDNVSRSLVQTIRSLSTAPSIVFKIVLASSPDVVEASFTDFKLTNVKYDAFVIEGDLTLEDFTSEPYPSGTFTPNTFPGLF